MLGLLWLYIPIEALSLERGQIKSFPAPGLCIPVLSESQIERVQLNGLAIFNQEAVAVVDILRCDIVGSLRLFQ